VDQPRSFGRRLTSLSVARQVCSVHGCPELAPCRIHNPVSARNHRGVPRQARGHGSIYERIRAGLLGKPCELRLEGCTGAAESADYVVPGDWTSRLRPACLHCQRSQGAALARAAR
jgi:hypothetical protein